MIMNKLLFTSDSFFMVVPALPTGTLEFLLLKTCFYLVKVQSGDDDSHDSLWNPSHMGDGSAGQSEGSGGVRSSSEASGHITRLASIDSFDSKW